MPVLIINSPWHDITTQEVSQIDVFPTILDIFNVNYNYKGINYSGLGKSIFSNAPGSGPSQEDYAVSEMIIKGDITR